MTKEGIITPEWRLTQGGQVTAIAMKESAFTRSFEITHEGRKLSLVVDSVFSRKMSLSGHRYSASITPAHFLTRKAKITGEWDDEALMAFAFWLSVLMWRRQSNKSSG